MMFPHVAVGGGGERDGDEPLVDVDEAVLEVPGVAPETLGILGVDVAGAGLVLERAPALAFDARAARPEALGQPGLPDVRRLDDVVVDADDLGEFGAVR